MAVENKWTCANRKTLVTSVDIRELPVGDCFRPKFEHLGEGGRAGVKRAVLDDAPLWSLILRKKSGFDRESTSTLIFESRAAAETASAKFQIGSEIEPFLELQPASKEFQVDDLSVATRLSVLGRGEPPYELVYETLHGAGVYENFKLSKGVLAWLGDEGARWLESEYGENWECVAVMEYCVRHFPDTSMACMAARILMADFIADCDYDAGYASRELEVFAGGGEALAQKTVEAQAQRAKAGGEKSREQRRQRLEALIQAIEDLSAVVGRMSEKRILEQAWEDAQAASGNMPKSAKTRFDYEVALRSEEPFKSRYRAVFAERA